MNIAVTGGNGFIGMKLTEALLKEGNRVTVLCRSEKNFDHLRARGARCIRTDIGDKSGVVPYLEGIEYVFHLAAVRLGEGRRSDLWRTNVDGTRNVLAASVESRVKKFIHCSSVAVMGYDFGQASVDEGYCEGRIVDDYQRTKREAEKLVREFTKRGLGTVIIRPAYVYGPGGLRFYRWIGSVYRHNRLTIFGNGNNTMHPVYIDDLIQAFTKVMSIPDHWGQEYIIAGQEKIRLEDFIKEIFAAFGLTSKINKIPVILPKDIVKNISYLYSSIFTNSFLVSACRLKPFLLSENFDTHRAREDFGFQPQVDYAQGIKNTICWLKENNYLTN